MTSTRELVADQREQFAFHDDIVYLQRDEAWADARHRRGDQQDQGRAGLDAPVPAPRLRPLPQAADADVDGRARQDRLRQDRLLPQAVRARREVVGRRPRPDQGDVREARHPRGGAEVPRRRGRPVRHRGRLPLRQGGALEARRRVHGHGPGASRNIPRSSASTSAPSSRHEDNKFSALNGAVWSGGSFVYVPKGVEVPLPLQAYFRINGENTGQFERTLIVVDEGAKVHYIEGCTAPIYATDSLHVAVVEVVALPGSKVRYTTIQNWSNDVYNLVTKRAHAHENSDGRVDRREHRLPQDRQVPARSTCAARAPRPTSSASRSRAGPAPGHRREGHPPGAEHDVPDRLEVRLEGRRPGARIAATSRSRRARPASSPASAATR